MLTPALIFLGGLATILFGAEWLLRGATRIATRFGISSLLIGLTVVSVGTSTPELAVGLAAVAEQKGSLAVGNIAGTNILNILLILGLSAAIRPLPTRLLSVRLDVPMMIVIAVGMLVMALDGVLSRAEGAVMLAAAVLYTIAIVYLSRIEQVAIRRQFAHALGPAAAPPPAGLGAGLIEVLQLVAGMVLTVLGAELLVGGAVQIARDFGVSEAFVGLTIVAIGTSAPELVTTLIATARNDRDVTIGNLIGSSIYNVLCILGLTVMAAPQPVEFSRDLLWFDLPVAALVPIVCLPVFRSDRMVSRREGLMFVAAYLVYLGWLLATRT